jgi:hypothetical protein
VHPPRATLRQFTHAREGKDPNRERGGRWMPQEPTSSYLRSLLQAVGRRAPQRATLPSTRVLALPVGGTKVSRAATLAPIAASRIASSLAHHKRRPTPPPPSDLQRPRPRQPRARRHQPRGSQALRRPPLPLFSLHASPLDPPSSGPRRVEIR